MNKIKNYELVTVANNSSVLCCLNSENLIKDLSPNTSVIYFVENCEINNQFVKSCIENSIDKILIISKHNDLIKNKKVIFSSYINSYKLKSLSQNISIIIDLNNNYKFAKFVIKNFDYLLNLSAKKNKNLYFQYSNSPIICSIIKNNSIYFDDILNCIKALLINKRNEQYSFIYDTVCDYLDDQFCRYNLCDFKNDQCVANRTNHSTHETMGCCHSFNYAKFFDFRLVKDLQICKYLQNKTCSTKNISCKLFTCKYLKKQNIRFDTHKILLLDCFFNEKQHEIIRQNFFKSREEILQKLQEKNYDLYLWYYLMQKFRIK